MARKHSSPSVVRGVRDHTSEACSKPFAHSSTATGPYRKLWNGAPPDVFFESSSAPHPNSGAVEVSSAALRNIPPCNSKLHW